jgi:hypothetical protein
LSLTFAAAHISSSKPEGLAIHKKAGKEPPPQPNAFEEFVQRIAAVPKAKIDALKAAERAQPRAKRSRKPKGATS